MNQHKTEIISGVITFVITMSVLLFLLLYMLPVIEPPKQEQYVSMMEDPGGDMLAKLGQTLEPTTTDVNDNAESQNPNETTDEAALPDGDELKDNGPQAAVSPKTVTVKTTSPMKEKEKPDPSGSKSASPKPKPANERSRETQVESQISKNMKGAFSKSTGAGQSQGSPTGAANTGSLEGTGAIGSGLVGYTVAFWGRPHSYYAGSVTVRVNVNARGQVTQATAVSGSGEAWNHNEVRRYCESESLKSRFSVPKNRTTEGIGTITWRFK